MNTRLQRMEETLSIMSGIGADPTGGITRRLYDGAWKEAQETLQKLFSSAGMQTRSDQVGNLFGLAEGTECPKELVLTGSHIDTVRNGGALDGQYGIIAGYLAIERLLQQYGQPKRTLGVVSFAEEEGSRFPYVYWGSKNMVGTARAEEVRDLKDADDKPFAEAMAEAGFDLNTLSPAPLAGVVAFVEAHIEQGGVLERNNRQIGVVTAIAGQKRYIVTLTGEANHAGTTPMGMRRDAVEGAARCFVTLLDAAKAAGDPLVLTFGRVVPKPNIGNVVPGEVEFSVDIRHPDSQALNDFAARAEQTIRETAAALDLSVHLNLWMNEAPVPMNAELVQKLSTVCETGGVRFERMHSGAGHDSQIIAPFFPTAMLFVPSVRGISHNPAEHTKMEDLVVGVDVLEKMLYELAYV